MNTEELPISCKDAKKSGNSFYFTGKPCKRGHISKRQTCDSNCVACKRLQNKDNAEYKKRYYQSNKSIVISRSKLKYEQLKKENPNYDKEQYAKNIEAHKAYRFKNRKIRNNNHKKWYFENHDYVLKYAKKYNSGVSVLKKRAQARKNYRNNKHSFIANVAKSRAAKLNRTPKWLTDSDKQEIKFVYKIASRVSKETNVQHHVDHIIPLQGEFVSGLHVPNNLQLLTALENLTKSNIFVAGCI